MKVFEQGDVVWSPHPLGERPFLIINNDTHPFQGEEYIALGITTTPRTYAPKIPDHEWVTGSLPTQSFVSPWFVVTIKHANIDRGVGQLTEKFTAAVIDEFDRYIEIGASVSFSE